MASRRAPRALRGSLAQLGKPSVSGRTGFAPLLAVRAAVPAQRAAVGLPFQQIRGVKTIDFAGTKEDVYGK